MKPEYTSGPDEQWVYQNKYIPIGIVMTIQKIDMNKPPENTKISISGKDCKCIKINDKTYINIKDVSDKTRTDINVMTALNSDLGKYIIDLCMYGQCDYYIDGSLGLTALMDKINNDKFWY